MKAQSAILCPFANTSPELNSVTKDLCDALEKAGCPLATPVRERLRFETLLGDLSAAFVNLPADDVDTEIEAALGRLVEFLNVDRGGLAEVLVEKNQLVITHSYHLPGIPRLPRIIVNEQLPWYARTIQAGKIWRVARLPDELPAEALQEREYCIQVGLKSHVMIPLQGMGSVVGALGFGAFRAFREWPDELIQRLRLVGEIFTNALARKRADQALRKAAEQTRALRDELAHATRVELVNQLTTSIAHEVNQPLCAIASNAQTAIDLIGMGEFAEAKLALEDIWSDARRGSEVIGRIRNLVKKDGSTRVPTNLVSIIHEIRPLLGRETAAKNVKLTIDLPGAELVVDCDRVQVQQVVLNLVLNAVDAVTEASVGPPEVWIRAVKNEESILVSVEDSGTGLSEEECTRVFDHFYTTKVRGLGMGLAISRSIIQAHGGNIWARRGIDHGSTFQFQLPVGRPTRK